MYRNQLEYLKKWLQKENRKPLVIRGARQVGKSTLVRLFAADRGLPLAELNLDRHSELDGIFATKDPQLIISEIEALSRMPRVSDHTLLFLDEIQGTEHAFPALRYFYEDCPSIPVIAAGSLLEFLLKDHKFAMPVGRIEYLHMGPLVFSEYLSALDETRLLSEVKEFKLTKKISATVHSRLLAELKSYFFVGGMPEAVKNFSEKRSYQDVAEVQRNLLDTYRDDFPKYAGSRSLPRMNQVFRHVAKNIGRKVKYSAFSTDDQSSTIKKDLELLCLARIVFKVTHSHCNGLPAGADAVDNIYKLMFLDVGLMNSVLGLDWSAVADFEMVNQGSNAEQFVGQHLMDLAMQKGNPELFYWLREGKDSNAEVDFVCNFQGKVVPIEVKSGASGTLKSLNQFVAEKDVSLAVRLDTNLPSVQRITTTVRSKGETKEINYDLISLPLYLVEKIPEIIQDFRPQ